MLSIYDDYAKIGNSEKIGDHVEIGNFAEIGDNVEIGERAKIGYYVDIGNSADIGDHVKIGNHADIGAWRRAQSLVQSLRLRPELVDAARKAGKLSKADEQVLQRAGKGAQI